MLNDFSIFVIDKANHYQRILLVFGGKYFLSILFNRGRLLLLTLTALRMSLTVEETCGLVLFIFSSLRLTELLSLRLAEFTLGIKSLL